MKTLREKLEDGVTAAFSQYASYEDARQAGIINIAADAALSALRQWLADQGLVVVPRDATQEMNSASYMLYMREKNNDSAWSGKKNGHLIYAAMIAAAPDALKAPDPAP